MIPPLTHQPYLIFFLSLGEVLVIIVGVGVIFVERVLSLETIYKILMLLDLLHSLCRCSLALDPCLLLSLSLSGKE